MQYPLVHTAVVAVTFAFTLTACGGGSSGAPTAGGPTFISFPDQSGLEQPGVSGVAVGTNNNVWFGAGKETFGEVGSLSTAGVISTHPLPFGQMPAGLAASPDGSLWFTEIGASPGIIGHLTAAGAVSYVVPPDGLLVDAITTGPDGAVWLTFLTPAGGIAIGRLSAAGALTLFPVETTANAADGITAGPDGALWFTMYNGTVGPILSVGADAIGRITTTGALRIFPLPKSGTAPGIITKGPDGALWFNEQAAPHIGRITTGGSIEEFSPPITPDPIGGIVGSMTAGNDGALWFIANLGVIGRITPAGTFTSYAEPPTAEFNQIVLGPQGAFWISDGAGAIWRFVP